MSGRDDIKLAKDLLSGLPADWDGKNTVLELKRVDYNWKQMEWWAFYFEWLCRSRLKKSFCIPGERIGRTTFDATCSINWDFKAKAIKSDDHRAILNDADAMNESIARHGEHGVIVGLCDVEYNDEKRSFQKWHTTLKGGKSDYELERETRTAVSRYRKTHARLVEIIFLLIDNTAVKRLSLHHQGRNSNGRPRPPKYMLEFDNAGLLITDRIVLE